jgi:nucleotide-binding universal stress UspA family protein
MANAATRHATVVVGVKGTGESRAAIRLAAQEARYRGASLVATIAYRTEPAMGAPAGRPLSVVHSADDGRTAAASALRDAVVDALGDQAEGVELHTVPGLAGRSLVDTAREGQCRAHRAGRARRGGHGAGHGKPVRAAPGTLPGPGRALR